MGFSSAAVFAGVDFKTWDITATLDADTGGSVTHGFGAAPADVYLTPLLAEGVLSAWYVSTINTTVITLTKGTATGSGAANPQVRLFVRRPHSIGA